MFPGHEVFLPRPSPASRAAVAALESAENMYDQVVAQVRMFSGRICEEYNGGVLFGAVGSTQNLVLTQIRYKNPDLLIFLGELEGGAPAEILMHVSQLHIILVAIPKKSEEAKRRIGFEGPVGPERTEPTP
jgi:hypothetical protein